MWTDDIDRLDLVLRGAERIYHNVLAVAVGFPYLLSNSSTPLAGDTMECSGRSLETCYGVGIGGRPEA